VQAIENAEDMLHLTDMQNANSLAVSRGARFLLHHTVRLSQTA